MKGRNARKRARYAQESEWAYRYAILSAECHSGDVHFGIGGGHLSMPGSSFPPDLPDDLGAQQHARCAFCDSPITRIVTNDGVTVWFRTPKLILEEP